MDGISWSLYLFLVYVWCSIEKGALIQADAQTLSLYKLSPEGDPVEGDTVILQCDAPNIQASHVIEWAKLVMSSDNVLARNGTSLDPRYAVFPSSTTQRYEHLLMDHANKRDTGLYYCRVKTSHDGSVVMESRPLYLSVHYFPSDLYPICSPSGPFTAQLGTTLIMSCISEIGNPMARMDFKSSDNVYNLDYWTGDGEQATSLHLTVGFEVNHLSFECKIASPMSFPGMERSCMIGPMTVVRVLHTSTVAQDPTSLTTPTQHLQPSPAQQSTTTLQPSPTSPAQRSPTTSQPSPTTPDQPSPTTSTPSLTSPDKHPLTTFQASTATDPQTSPGYGTKAKTPPSQSVTPDAEPTDVRTRNRSLKPDITTTTFEAINSYPVALTASVAGVGGFLIILFFVTVACLVCVGRYSRYKKEAQFLPNNYSPHTDVKDGPIIPPIEDSSDTPITHPLPSQNANEENYHNAPTLPLQTDQRSSQRARKTSRNRADSKYVSSDGEILAGKLQRNGTLSGYDSVSMFQSGTSNGSVDHLEVPAGSKENWREPVYAELQKHKKAAAAAAAASDRGDEKKPKKIFGNDYWPRKTTDGTKGQQFANPTFIPIDESSLGISSSHADRDSYPATTAPVVVKQVSWKKVH